jgi:N-acetylmuramic acid 6-phosphate etherase
VSKEVPLPQTELQNPRTAGLDVLTTLELVDVLAREQRAAVEAVEAVSDVLAGVVDEVARRLSAGGKLHYVGSGSSGRLGFLDASEMPPTFGTPPELVCAHISGGAAALRHSIEGAEDDGSAGEAELRGHIAAADAVIGISASGGAPFVVRAIAFARAIGAFTIGVANTRQSLLGETAEVSIVLNTGPEPLTGSTRLKAGTAQKVLLNTLSTATMVRLGKVYDNFMIDVVASNAKLRRRALGLVERLTGAHGERARGLLDAAGGRVKVAVVMARLDVDAERARELLEEHHGRLRGLID